MNKLMDIMFYLAIAATTAAVIMFASVITASADTSFTLQNETEIVKVMSVYWVDHDFENYPWPVRVMCVELQPGEQFKGNHAYPGRSYISDCHNAGSKVGKHHNEDILITDQTQITVFCYSWE